MTRFAYPYFWKWRWKVALRFSHLIWYPSHTAWVSLLSGYVMALLFLNGTYCHEHDPCSKAYIHYLGTVIYLPRVESISVASQRSIIPDSCRVCFERFFLSFSSQRKNIYRNLDNNRLDTLFCTYTIGILYLSYWNFVLILLEFCPYTIGILYYTVESLYLYYCNFVRILLEFFTYTLEFKVWNINIRTENLKFFLYVYGLHR